MTQVLAVTAEGQRRTRVPFEAPIAAVGDIRSAVVALTSSAQKAARLCVLGSEAAV